MDLKIFYFLQKSRENGLLTCLAFLAFPVLRRLDLSPRFHTIDVVGCLTAWPFALDKIIGSSRDFFADETAELLLEHANHSTDKTAIA